MGRAATLSGGCALVTAASRGKGRATALALAEARCDPVGVAGSRAALAQRAVEVEAPGCDFLAVQLDPRAGKIEARTNDAWRWRDALAT
jgi:NAD(P)-dependent dehydrogenase (short-subunit alcohol dehydrogenase family)